MSTTWPEPTSVVPVVAEPMAGELNTEVKSDPASCRATAAWLGRLSPGVDDASNAIHGARSTSEFCWQGAAAEAFRDSLSPMTKDADELAAIIDRVRQALEIFADEIDTVRARLVQAREVAMAARLIVTPTAILPPGPGLIRHQFTRSGRWPRKPKPVTPMPYERTRRLFPHTPRRSMRSLRPVPLLLKRDCGKPTRTARLMLPWTRAALTRRL